MKTKVLQIVAFVIVIASIVALFINQQLIAVQQEKTLEQNNTIITTRIDELEAKVDTDTIIQIKECETKAIQTVINIFSPREITKDSSLEYDFDFFSDEAYEKYLMLRSTFAGQQLVTVNANGSGYDARLKSIQVFVPFYYSGFEGRSQFSFNFIKKEDKWIIESFSSDA